MCERAKKKADKLRLLAAGSVTAALALSALAAAKAPEKSADSTGAPVKGSSLSTTNATPAAREPAPSTPREYFNAGTTELAAGKLREAEAFLESALASQRDELQSPALYNLGHVRFDQGVEELKKGPSAGPTAAHGDAAAQSADRAIQAADAALAGDDIQKMVAAYMNGRGVRKDLKSATTAVQDALSVYRTALAKWERSSGDFKGAVEIKHSDGDAAKNAEIVDRCIARLVDSVRKLQQCNNGMGAKGQQLSEKLKKLKGRIPAPNMPPGAGGDDDEDEENPPGPKPGQKEGATKEGQQMNLTPEQAGWLLDGFKLDSERRLPMGQGQLGEPKDRSRPTW